MAEPTHVSDAEQRRIREADVSHVLRYWLVWMALLFWTVTTWWLSRFHFPGGWEVVVVLVIAAVKGTLVALFFMHLWDHRGANRLVLLTALVFVALLVGLTIADNATRFPLANPPGSDVPRSQSTTPIGVPGRGP